MTVIVFTDTVEGRGVLWKLCHLLCLSSFDVMFRLTFYLIRSVGVPRYPQLFFHSGLNQPQQDWGLPTDPCTSGVVLLSCELHLPYRTRFSIFSLSDPVFSFAYHQLNGSNVVRCVMFYLNLFIWSKSNKLWTFLQPELNDRHSSVSPKEKPYPYRTTRNTYISTCNYFIIVYFPYVRVEQEDSTLVLRYVFLFFLTS